MMFKIRPEAGTYYLKWESEEQRLYMFIEPETPCKGIEDNRLVLVNSGQICKIAIERSMNEKSHKLPPLHNATYHFKIYNNENAKGRPISQRRVYIGSHARLEKHIQAYKDGFCKMTVSSHFFIPKEYFWLDHKDMPVGQCFFLPDMERCGNEYVTSCLLKQEVCHQWQICIDSRVSDYLKTDA